MIPIALVTLSALVAPPHLVKATDGGAVLSPTVQWQLIAACPRLKLDLGYASAVAIGRDDNFTYLLTADHAVKDASEVEVQFYTRGSYPLPDRTVKGAATLVYSKEADFALFRILNPPPNYPLAVQRAAEAVCGIPLVDPVPILKLPPPNRRPKRFPFDAVSVGCSGGAAPSGLAESIRAKRFARDEKNTDDPGSFVWEATRAQQTGRSGGPLVSADGTVIGLCRARSTTHGYYTHLDEIQAVLKEKHAFLWEK